MFALCRVPLNFEIAFCEVVAVALGCQDSRAEGLNDEARSALSGLLRMLAMKEGSYNIPPNRMRVHRLEKPTPDNFQAIAQSSAHGLLGLIAGIPPESQSLRMPLLCATATMNVYVEVLQHCHLRLSACRK